MNNKNGARSVNSGIWMACIVSVFLTMGACGSGSQTGYVANPAPAGPVVEPAEVIVESDPSFDIYRASNANKVIIYLHGAGGNKHHAAYQFGINLSDVDGEYGTVNEQVLLANKAMAVFPQGQASAAAPEALTWGDHVTNSGRNDMAFISDLVGLISARFHVSRFYIVGHSTGGMLANQIWCEDPDLFDGYIAIAGPPSARFLDPSTSCSPAAVKPYLGIVRSDDKVLGAIDNWDAPTWTINQTLMLPALDFVDPVVIGERDFLKTRVEKRCGETVLDGDASATTDNLITTWSFCDNSIKLMRVEVDPGQGLEVLQNEVWGFLSF